MSDDPLDVAGLVVAVGVEQVDVCGSNPHLALEADGDDFKMVLEISSGIFEPDEPALELEVVVRVSVGSLAGRGSHTCFVRTLHIYSIPSLQQLITLNCRVYKSTDCRCRIAEKLNTIVIL